MLSIRGATPSGDVRPSTARVRSHPPTLEPEQSADARVGSPDTSSEWHSPNLRSRRPPEPLIDGTVGRVLRRRFSSNGGLVGRDPTPGESGMSRPHPKDGCECDTSGTKIA